MDTITMNQETFWDLMRMAKEVCGEDLTRELDWLENQLLFMGAQQALDFHHLTRGYRCFANRYGLWTAANLICGGLSDDRFTDFCAWLVAQGREVYMAALKDPDTLAGVKPYGDCSFEALSYLGDKAYAGLTGRSVYDSGGSSPFENLQEKLKNEIPLGEGINYPYNSEEAKKYLPRLCAKYDAARTGSWNYDSPLIQKAMKRARKSSRVREDCR